MRHLPRKRDRFLSIAANYSTMYSYADRREQLILTSGILNFVWNSWNNIWRDLWLAHISGGIYFDGTSIHPIYPTYTDKQACHYLLFILGKRNRHNLNDAILGCHQEATWGDPNIISRISASLSPSYAHFSYILGILGTYQTELEHFQKIRNSFTHLNNENIFHLNSLTGYYSFGPNQKLLDILEAQTIINSNRCFDSLISNMTGMLMNL